MQRIVLLSVYECVCVGYYLDVFKVNQHNNVMWVEWGAGGGQWEGLRELVLQTQILMSTTKVD
jgi:hypothetical protein